MCQEDKKLKRTKTVLFNSNQNDIMIIMIIYSEDCTKYGIMQVKNMYSTLKFKQIST